MNGIVHQCAEVNRDTEEFEQTSSIDSEEESVNPSARRLRKWLIRDASYKLEKEPPCSVMKETYPWPPKADTRTRIGKRRTNVEMKFYEELAKQLAEERKEQPPIEKYCTTYDSTYFVEGFQVQDEKEMYGKHPELYEKYPLYGSEPMSYWQFVFENKNGSDKKGIPDIKQPFKRRSTISKPLNEVLDEVKY